MLGLGVEGQRAQGFQFLRLGVLEPSHLVVGWGTGFRTQPLPDEDLSLEEWRMLLPSAVFGLRAGDGDASFETAFGLTSLTCLRLTG